MASTYETKFETLKEIETPILTQGVDEGWWMCMALSTSTTTDPFTHTTTTTTTYICYWMEF